MSINVAAIPSPFIHATIKRRKNTWYTIASGNWSDPNIWMSNSRRRYSSPQTGDDVSIGLGHTVTYDAPIATTLSLNNFYIAGSFLVNNLASRTINVLGDLQATGSVNLSSSTNFILGLGGVSNFINDLQGVTNSTISYLRVGDQFILPFTHNHLLCLGGGTKTLSATTQVNGNLTISALLGGLNMGVYDLTVNGTTAIGNTSTIASSFSGNYLFIGSCSFGSGSFQSITASPVFEFRNGFVANALVTNLGVATVNFTTNSQSVTGTGAITLSGAQTVVGAITVTNSNTAIWTTNATINNSVAGGSFINKGTVYFNSTSSLPSFTTGTFDRTSFANTVGYTMGASITLPYTSYSSLLITNTGIKTSVGNTTLSGNLTISNAVTASGAFELSSFDLSVAGTTTIAAQAGGVNSTLSKSGAGNVLFTGQIIIGTSNSGAIDFSTGNPTVELRGGFTSSASSATTIKSGTGRWTFSTNSQALNGSTRMQIDAPMTISGAITLSVTGSVFTAGATPSGYLQFNNTIIGDNAASKLLLNGGALLINTSTQPMASLGVFDYTTNTNTVGYIFDGNFTLPSTTYSGLFVAGSGTKTLSGNTTISGNLMVGSAAGVAPVLELSTFNFTVNGVTTLGQVSNNLATISKNGAGSVLFVGQIQNGAGSASAIDFSLGNPTVELRGGTVIIDIKSGIGQWTLSTNNQSFLPAGASFDAPLLISGAITVTLTSTTTSPKFTGIINGNNAASTLDNRITSTGGLQYQATQQPMLTGVLQTNLAANTFLYNAAGNQDVKGTTYRTLTLAGSGIKTLQGNVVVATLYTLTPPATLALNGFTRT